MLRWLLLSIGCWWLSASAIAQSVNPFEIRARLPRTEIKVADNGTIVPRNPFDVVVHRVPGVSEAVLSAAVERRPRTFFHFPQGNTLPTSTIFVVLASILLLLGIAVASNRSIVGKTWGAFLNENALTVAQRDATGLIGSTPYYLLYVHFLLNAGLFTFLIVRVFEPERYNNFGVLALCMALTAGFFLSKHAFLRALAWLYPLGKDVDRYHFLIVIFNCVLGLFLLPFNWILAYAQPEYTDFLAFWTLGLVGIFYLYRLFRAFRIASKFLIHHTFHFLLYLCTVEIAPLLLLYKMFTVKG